MLFKKMKPDLICTKLILSQRIGSNRAPSHLLLFSTFPFLKTNTSRSLLTRTLAKTILVILLAHLQACDAKRKMDEHIEQINDTLCLPT
jgi:hypothetical protein